MAAGVAFFVIGLLKKLAIADPVGGAGDADLRRPPARRGARGLARRLAPSRSGSTSTSPAIPTWRSGLARMFGIRLPYNFASPYQATSIIEFWRRWHMTLSRFLRDYVYIPLGGNRRGPARRHLNLMLTMLLGGLWHGAAWTFVAWGALHGLYLLVNHAWSSAVARAVAAAAAVGAVARRRAGADAAGRDGRLGVLRRAGFRGRSSECCRHGRGERHRHGPRSAAAVDVALAGGPVGLYGEAGCRRARWHMRARGRAGNRPARVFSHPTRRRSSTAAQRRVDEPRRWRALRFLLRRARRLPPRRPSCSH